MEFAVSEKKLVKIVLNRYNPNSIIGKKIIANLGSRLENYWGNRVAFSSCFMQGSCVIEIDPHSTAAQKVKLITDEILSLMNAANAVREEYLEEA